MHTHYLLAALEQAELGRGICSPNPSVGAVVVLNGKIIARDYHRGAGTPHAEALVFQQFPADLADAILYVTLEPCNHWGRTPPCVDAIINHGIKKVVYGYRDPNPAVMKNNTPAILARHGIEAIYLPIPEIDAFYESYEYWCVHKRPFVTAKIAQTLDSKIANADGSPRKISGSQCNQFTHQQRLKTDAILTSARTIICDNPSLNARLDSGTFKKNIAILDRNLSLTGAEKVFDCAKKCYVYSSRQSAHPATEHIEHHIISENQSGLNLDEVLISLGQLGFHDVWLEAGAQLFSAFHHAGLVNRSYVYISSEIAGEKAISAFPDNCFAQQKKEVNWLIMGNDIALRIDWR